MICPTRPFPASTPTEILAQRIRARDWEEVQRRACSHPWDAQYRTSNRATPLHLVCLHRGPHRVVQAVLESFPTAIMVRDEEGWTPLHVALLYGADEETSLLLLRRGGAAAAGLQSQWVSSPLHLACRFGVTSAVLEALIKINPDMAKQSSGRGSKPAALLWNEFTKNRDHQHVVKKLRSSTGSVSKTDPGVEKLMQRLRVLLRASSSSNATEETILYQVISHQDDLGLYSFIPLVARLYPEQTQRMDSTGDLPLHLASAIPARRVHVPLPQKFPIISSEPEPVEVLLNINPDAARIPNAQGRLALHIALYPGRRTWTQGIRPLLNAAPAALLTRDPHTLLYPVLMAAAYESNDEIESLNTIYELLLASPPVLQHGLE